MRRHLRFAFISALISTVTVQAAESLKLDTLLKSYPQLNGLISQSWENNLQLKSAETNQKAAQALYQAARKNWYPSFWTNSSWQRLQTTPERRLGTNFANSLNLTQPVWDASIENGIGKTDAINEQSYWQHLSLKNQIAFNVLTTYFQYLSTSNIQDIYKTIIKNVETRRNNIKAEVDLGQKIEVDLLDVEAQLLDKKYLLTQSENEAQKAVKLLTLLLNRTVTDKEMKKQKLSLLNIPQALNLENLALRNNPDILQLDAKVKELDYSYQDVRDEFIPSLYVNSRFGYNSADSIHADSESENWEISAALRWEFGDLTRSSRRLATARQKLAAEESRDYVRQEVPTEISTTSLELKTISANLTSLDKRLQQLQKVYELRQEQYRLGQVSITDLTIAEDNLLNARISYIGAQSDYNINCMKLWLLSGGQ